jgi:hypothetical protein
VNGGPLLRHTRALSAYSSPVAYCSDDEVEHEYLRVIKNVEGNLEYVKSLGEETVRNQMFSLGRHAVLCTKHPGFSEEREWRVIYSPTLLKSERITSSIECVNGTPQPVCKIPFKDVPEEGLYGLNVPDILDRVIVGPSKFPVGMCDAFVTLLGEVGVQNPGAKVILSQVPLRQ